MNDRTDRVQTHILTRKTILVITSGTALFVIWPSSTRGHQECECYSDKQHYSSFCYRTLIRSQIGCGTELVPLGLYASNEFLSIMLVRHV